MKKFLYILFVLTAVMCIFLSVSVSAEEVSVPVILYHNIADETPGEDYNPFLNVSADLFEQHIKALKDDGYSAITYEDYYNYVYHDAPLPDKPIIISFDDGYSSNYMYAYPILKKYGVKATIFVITDRRGMALSKNPHFSWNQAREMLDSGIIDIQSHTHTHQMATTLTDEQLVYELTMSKRLIENNLRKKCSVIAFPFGDAGEREIEAEKKAGYLIVNKVGDAGVNYKSEGTYALKRLTVRADWTGKKLIEVIEENKKL